MEKKSYLRLFFYYLFVIYLFTDYLFMIYLLSCYDLFKIYLFPLVSGCGHGGLWEMKGTLFLS